MLCLGFLGKDMFDIFFSEQINNCLKIRKLVGWFITKNRHLQQVTKMLMVVNLLDDQLSLTKLNFWWSHIVHNFWKTPHAVFSKLGCDKNNKFAGLPHFDKKIGFVQICVSSVPKQDPPRSNNIDQ